MQALSTIPASLSRLFYQDSSMQEFPVTVRCRLRLKACALAALLVPIAGGCSAPWGGSAPARNTTNPFTAPTAPNDTDSTGPHTEEEALADVFDDLEAIGEIDPLARQKLTNDLRSVKPEHWPLMVTQFKSALAYRQQLAEQETTPVAAKTQAAPEDATPTVLISDSEPEIDRTAQPLPPPPATMKMNMPSDFAVQQASYTSKSPSTSFWTDDLDAVIAKLEDETGHDPGSTDDVHQHMRLRMLYLLAGRQSDAMLPIPGAAPEQQDYWAKQLFALESFLDNQRQPDDKQRAAASLMHLDQARAKLAELATLQLRNLAFVDSVDGYGIYRRRETREFRPGDQVTLYAEVENFRSESTKEGYRTALSTSYEVVDASGQRVDGRQFPDVEDICQNPRRDFHMQYGVALPTRIYPGEYQLRLTITDQLSHKIGQTSVPFEIVE